MQKFLHFYFFGLHLSVCLLWHRRVTGGVINILLNGFHKAASQTDTDRYLRYLTNDGGFIYGYG